MRNYRFRQASLFTADWDGELRNIPEDAVFYCCSELNKRQQEWYIVMTDKEYGVERPDDFDWFNNFNGEGCVQVRYYDILELRIIHLVNVKPYEEWPDVGKEKFYEIYGDFFRNTYVIERTSGRYEFDNSETKNNLGEFLNFKMIEAPRIVACYRLKGLSSDGCATCTQVSIYGPIQRKESYLIMEGDLKLYQLQTEYYDPLKLKKELTHSCLEYEKVFNEVVEKLF